jgi:hypothetical protein
MAILKDLVTIFPWHGVDDDEFNRFAIEQLKETDLLLFGRKIYHVMEAAWSRIAADPATSKDNQEIAKIDQQHRQDCIFQDSELGRGERELEER